MPVDLSPALLDQVLDASPACFCFLRAIRPSASSPITDFQVKRVNPALAQLQPHPRLDWAGRSLRELYGGGGPSGLWDRLGQVCQTGVAFRGIEFFPHPEGGGWYDLAVTGQGDELVVHFVPNPLPPAGPRQPAPTPLQQVLDTIPLAVSLLRPQYGQTGELVDLVFDLANPAAARLLGLPLEAVIGQSYSTLLPQAVAQGGMAFMQQILSDRQPAHFELEYNADGLSGWFAQSITPVAGNLLFTTHDITDRKQAQEQTRRQAETFDAVLGSMLHGLTVFGVIEDETGQLADLRYEYVSDQVLRETGLSRPQLIGQTLLTLFPDNRSSAFWPAYQTVLQTGQPQQFEEHYHYDGYDNYLHCQVVKIDLHRLVTTYQVVNELKKAQHAAEQQALLLRSVLDGSQNNIIALEAIRPPTGELVDLRYLLQNETYRRLTGYEDEQVLGRPLSEVSPQLASPDLLERYAAVIQTGQPFSQDLAFDAGHFRGWYNLSVLQRGDGVVLTLQDKTAEKRAEESLLAQQRQLETTNLALSRSNENLQQFAYVASHDLQEPLRKIRLFGDRLQGQYGSMLPTAGLELLERMQGAADRMAVLIRDLLALSKLSTPPPFGAVDLNQVLAEVISDLELVITEKGAHISLTSLPVVQGDALQLGQAFQNLIANALKFQRPGQVPQVRVDCERLGLDELPAGLLPPSGSEDKATAGHPRYFYALDVIDNGIGFDAARYGEKVFGAFQRLQDRSSPYSGTGIGLAIVRKVAQNHGGGVGVTSEEGQGARFTLYLPAF
ncbi:MAG TPA: PAS domain-containing protein [Spirosoma sp.]|nr:PAS domain-containing protein [Spirosoma sp.]